MIYDFIDITKPIKQGDIFLGIPRIDISLKEIPIVTGDNDTPELSTWEEIVKEGKEIPAILAVKPVMAIVASQDCDVSNGRDITLFEIRDFRDVEGKCRDTKSLKKWINIITHQARLNQKWFYLPPDSRIGFSEKMAVDLRVTLRVPKNDLEELKSLRKGRLNSIADEHFRERISEFYRRYPYDEWYSLSNEELDEYLKEYPEITPFPWQIKLKAKE